MSASITPTVGRKIWFFPSAVDTILRDGDEPLDASIAGINATRVRVVDLHPGLQEVGPRLTIDGVDTTRVANSINISVNDFQGRPFTRPGVQIWNGEGDKPEHGYCAWMPYQQGQAKQADGGAGAMTPSDVQSNLKTLYSNFNELRRAFAEKVDGIENMVSVLAQRVDELCRGLGEPVEGQAVGNADAQGGLTEETSKPEPKAEADNDI